MNCLCCGMPLNVRSLVEGSQVARHNETLYADCLNSACELQGVTLPLDELLTLSPAQIESWGRMNTAKRERQVRMYGTVYAEVAAGAKTQPQALLTQRGVLG